MSNYTTQVRFICEQKAGLTESEGQDSINDIIANALTGVFNFDFPIFDEAYRSVLETKILKHYYTREIAFETVGLWQLKLDTRLNEIMPYYNKMYESELLDFNPFNDVDYTRTHEGERNDTGNQTDAATTSATDHIVNSSDSWDKFSDTPQGSVSNLDNSTYLTNARNVEADSTSDATKTQTDNRTTNNRYNSLDEYTERIFGKMGTASYSDLLNKFRSTFLNIDMMIIEELSDLFFNLY